VGVAAPLHGFALPRLGRTPIGDWTLAGGHLAERNQLVLLIALGESILAIGATFAGLSWRASVVGALAVGFVETASLWWMYFGRAEDAARTIDRAADPARVGRAGYAYAHGIMVAGVIVLAVAIELTIAQPTQATSARTAAVILGGPVLYLLGNALFKRSLIGRVPPSRIFGVLALVLLIPVAVAADRLVLSAATTLVLATLATATVSERAPRWRLRRER
jgi:low temperature requirement protein LtrA